jgi:hypothetical protein
MRLLVLSFVVFTFVLVLAPSASAQAVCVICPETDCSYIKPDGTWVVTVTPRCDFSNPCNERGCREDCHNVPNCGGCMGWSCYVWDAEEPVLRQEEAVISVQPADAEK